MMTHDEPSERGVAIELGVIAMFALAACAFLVNVPAVLGDGDTGWHVAAGRWMLEHRAAPHEDPFSFTMAGRPWVAHEWLSEVAMAFAFGAAGWAGVVVFFSLSATALFVILGLEVRRWLHPAPLFGALALAFAVAQPLFVDRPHLLALPVLALWTIGLLRAREAERTPSLWLIPLMTLWANLHGDFIVGLALLAPFAAEAILAAPGRRLAVTLRWSAFGLAALGASLLTPQGLEGLVFPFKVSALAVTRLIGEWRPASFDTPSAFEIAVMATLLVCLARGVKVPPMRVLILLGALHLGLEHLRHQGMLAVLGPLLLAEPIGRALRSGAALPRPGLAAATRLHWPTLRPAIAAVTLIAFAMVAAALIGQARRPDGPSVPATALAHVPRWLRDEPVFNEYGFGGLLILEHVRPFIDGRADMYGDTFTRNAIRIADGDRAQWAATVARYSIRWTILPPDRALVAVLDHDVGWRRIYADKWAVVHMAISAPPARAAGPGTTHDARTDEPARAFELHHRS